MGTEFVPASQTVNIMNEHSAEIGKLKQTCKILQQQVTEINKHLGTNGVSTTSGPPFVDSNGVISAGGNGVGRNGSEMHHGGTNGTNGVGSNGTNGVGSNGTNGIGTNGTNGVGSNG